MSTTAERRIVFYPLPKTHRLFKAWKKYAGDSEKMNEIIEHFFNSTMSERERQQLLDSCREQKK